LTFLEDSGRYQELQFFVPDVDFTSAQNAYALIAVSIANAFSAKLNAIHVKRVRISD
jgi:hypothetical protein